MNLHVDNLGCRRGGRTVFRALGFHVDAGHILFVRGPNGVGKSTLLRVLAGFVPAAEGSARLTTAGTATADLVEDRGGWQEHVAYAGHLDAIKPALSVRANLDAWAGVWDRPPEAVEAALTRFGLDRIAERPAAECSAGQKRRLGLARLLVGDRPVWLLDEPTVSLDADATALVATMMQEHADAGGIVLAATHIALGLPETDVLTIAPILETATTAGTDDAFLDGTWT